MSGSSGRTGRTGRAGVSMFSRDDIKKAICEGHLKIFPYDERNITGAGYNLSTMNFAFSIRKHILLKINVETLENGNIHYVNIPPNDTVLFFSKEYIETDNEIAGIFMSKVARVCQGLGNISTTLDPMWKGQLIISVNNPTGKHIRLDLDREHGNIFTLLLFRLETPVTGEHVHDNNKGRCDLLIDHFKRNKGVFFLNKKYLDLKEFVIDEFANSLNGYDNFRNEDIEDCYTERMRKLCYIEDRIKKHVVLFREGRYTVDADIGNYKILYNSEEEKEIKSCKLYNMDKNTNYWLGKEYSLQDIRNQKKELIQLMESYIRIIDYELDIIRHDRRILWQNTEIAKYAKENNRAYTCRKVLDIIVGVIIAIGVACLAHWFSFLVFKKLLSLGLSNKDIYINIFSAGCSLIVGIISGIVLLLIEKKRR